MEALQGLEQVANLVGSSSMNEQQLLGSNINGFTASSFDAKNGENGSIQNQIMENIQTPCFQEKFVCPIYSKVVNEESSVTTHLQFDSNNKHFETVSEHLSRHGLKSFECNECEESFYTMKELSEHLKFHLDDEAAERPFSCEECGMRFGDKKYLTQHLTRLFPVSESSTENQIEIVDLEDKSSEDKHQNVDMELNSLEENDPLSFSTFSRKSSEDKHQNVDMELNSLEEKDPSSFSTFSRCQEINISEKTLARDCCGNECSGQSSLDSTALNLLDESSKNITGEGPNSLSLLNESSEKSPSKMSSNKRNSFECFSFWKAKKYKCFVCKKAFARINCLQVHVQSHSGKESSCGLCGSIFSFIATLYKHLQWHTAEIRHECDRIERKNKHLTTQELSKHLQTNRAKEKTYEYDNFENSISPKNDSSRHLNVFFYRTKAFACDFCPKKFLMRQSLRVHLRIHTGEKPYSCEVCQKSFSLKDTLKKHCRIHLESKAFTCENCSKAFYTSNELTVHSRNCREMRPFKCEFCQKAFRKSSALCVHRILHTGVKPYVCNICEKGFVYESALKRHVIVHTGGKPYQCDVCQKRFTQTSGLNTHRLIHKGVKAFACENCSKAFYTGNQLRIHSRVCNGERPYQCEICEKTFKCQNDVRVHRRIHTGEKPYVCDFCQKAFSASEHLKRHTRLHTGEKPHHCKVCQRGFIQSYNLKIHLRTHRRDATAISSGLANTESSGQNGASNELSLVQKSSKGFACEFCQKAFRTNSALCVHKRVHTGEKPYVCEECQKGFANQNHLKRHIRIHTGERPYQCKVCQKGFTQSYNMKIHLETHNRDPLLSSGLTAKDISNTDVQKPPKSSVLQSIDN